MMAIVDKSNYLLETKKQIKNAIMEKGVSITDTDSFRSYANKIGQIKEIEGDTSTTTGNWQPESDWFDIEKILEEDTEEYTMKIICLLTDELDDGSTTNTVRGGEKYKLSDGQIIEQSATTNLDISNLFDTSKDKECRKGYKTRYIIYYSNASTMNITIPDNVVYIILDGVKFNSSPFSNKRFVQSIKFNNNCKFTNTNMNNMFYGCYSLQSVHNLETSNVTNMNYMFSSCYLLQSVPNIDTSNVTSMTNMFSSCYSLQSVSNIDTSNVITMSSMFSNCKSLQSVLNIDTSNVTNMSNLFMSCDVLKKVGDLDTSNMTSMNNIFNNCNLLIDIKSIGKIISGLYFSNASYLNHRTLLKILNALINLSGNNTQTLSLGNTNLSKLTDEEKAIATNKNWTLA